MSNLGVGNPLGNAGGSFAQFVVPSAPVNTPVRTEVTDEIERQPAVVTELLVAFKETLRLPSDDDTQDNYLTRCLGEALDYLESQNGFYLGRTATVKDYFQRVHRHQVLQLSRPASSVTASTGAYSFRDSKQDTVLPDINANEFDVTYVAGAVTLSDRFIQPICDCADGIFNGMGRVNTLSHLGRRLAAVT